MRVIVSVWLDGGWQNTYTRFILCQKLFTDAIIVALLAEGVDQIIYGRSLGLRQGQFRWAQLLAHVLRAIECALASNLRHGCRGAGAIEGIVGESRWSQRCRGRDATAETATSSRAGLQLCWLSG